MPSRNAAIVFGCLLCVGHGFRLRSVEEGTEYPWRALARLLLGFAPACPEYAARSGAQAPLCAAGTLGRASRVPRSACMYEALEPNPLGDWITTNGGFAKGCSIGEVPNGLGLIATEDVPEGHVFVKLTPECMLSASSPEAATVKPLCDAIDSADLWSCRLGLLLLSERIKGPTSRFSPYIGLLPGRFTVPQFWGPDAVQRVHEYFGPVWEQVDKRARFMSSFAKERLQGGCAEFQGVPIDAGALTWAAACCSSRAFEYGGEKVLLPLIDMANHAGATEKNSLLQRNGSTMDLVASKPIKKGEEVTHSYATHSYGVDIPKDSFLLDFGFLADSETATDRVPMPWSDGKLLNMAFAAQNITEEFEPWQYSTLDSCVGNGTEFLFITRAGVDDKAWMACRIMSATSEDELREAENGALQLKSPNAELKAVALASALVQTVRLTLAGQDEDVLEGMEQQFGTELADQFMTAKEELCNASLANLSGRMEELLEELALTDPGSGAADDHQALDREKKSKKRKDKGAKGKGFGIIEDDTDSEEKEKKD